MGRAVVETPGTCGGAPRIDGTRITVACLASCRAAGWDDETILRNYPSLTEDDILAAWMWCAEHPMTAPHEPDVDALAERLWLAWHNDTDPGAHGFRGMGEHEVNRWRRVARAAVEAMRPAVLAEREECVAFVANYSAFGEEMAPKLEAAREEADATRPTA